MSTNDFPTTNALEDGGELLASFADKPQANAFFCAWSEVAQGLEDDIQAIEAGRDIETAPIDQLRKYGDLYGCPQGGLTEDEYRRIIKALSIAVWGAIDPETIFLIWITMLGIDESRGSMRVYTQNPAEIPPNGTYFTPPCILLRGTVPTAPSDELMDRYCKILKGSIRFGFEVNASIRLAPSTLGWTTRQWTNFDWAYGVC